MKLSEYIANDPFRGLIWGKSGDGKTSLIGEVMKYEEFYPAFWMDFDLRIASLRARLTNDEMSRIEFEPFRDVRMQGEAWINAETIANGLQSRREIHPESGRESVVPIESNLDKKYKTFFKSIIVDSQTFAARALMGRVLYTDGMKPPTTTPQLQHYMQHMSAMEEFISKLCGSGRNIFITFHEDDSKDEVTGRLFKTILVIGQKSANRLPGYFNEVWHTEVQQVPGKDSIYTVRTRSDALYGCRTSYRALDSLEKQEAIWPKVVKQMREAKALVSGTATLIK